MVNVKQHTRRSKNGKPVQVRSHNRKSAFFRQGEAFKKGIKSKDVNQRELTKGIKVEMEHTTDKSVARKIALDHLAEIPDYYSRLQIMEKQAKR